MTRLITVLLATHNIRPFTLEENKAFKNLMEIAEPAFYVPSRPTFSQKGGPAVYYDTYKLKRSFKTQTVVLTTDGWTSRATCSYITTIGHFIDLDWVLHSYMLQRRPIFTLAVI